MPTYTIRNKLTEETHDVIMSWTKLQEYLEANPDFENTISAPAIVDPYALGLKKTDSTYRARMDQIKKNNIGSTIRTGNLIEV